MSVVAAVKVGVGYGSVGFAGGGRFSFEVVVRGLTALTAHDREVGFYEHFEAHLFGW